jgi:excisionase family DNA binding protein
MSQDLQEQIDKINSRLWPVEAVMERLSVGRSMVFELVASGELRSVKVGRRRLVSEAAICEYIERIDQATA